MAKKIKLTRPELKRYRDALDRYERYLPMLKLKQQQLQMKQREVGQRRTEMEEQVARGEQRFHRYKAVLAEPAGLPVRKLGEVEQVRTSRVNIAGLNLPVFEEAVFPRVTYSLFGTPAWVDRALADLREISRRRAERDVLQEEYDLLMHELTRIVQRVNLFEKIKIPEAREAIRVIRIKLGDEMTAAVGRAKIAKKKLDEAKEGQASIGEPAPAAESMAEDEGEEDQGA